MLHAGRDTLRSLRTPTGLLALVAAAVCVADGLVTIATHPFMVDLEIPLRAAERWLAGGEPYLATAFDAGARAADLPFLYPPPVLPLLAPLTALPRFAVIVPWLALTAAAAAWLLRRLGLPWWAVPVALGWVPFSEGLVGGNVQVFLVAGFVAVFFGRPEGAFRPSERDPAGTAGRLRDVADGLAVAATPALKVSQPHAWVALLRRRPSSALLGLALVAAVAAATLPLTGTGAWEAWLAQLGRAADPSWVLRGSSLVQLFPPLLGAGLTVLSVLAVLVLPPGRIATWTGTLLVLGAPSLRNFGVLFLLPAILAIRRDAALLAVILVGAGIAPAVWAGIAVVVATLAWEARRAGTAASPPS